MKYDKSVESVRRRKNESPATVIKKPVESNIHTIKSMDDDPRRLASIEKTVIKHKKRHKKNYILNYLLLTFIFIIVATTLSFTVFFNINSITVNDNPIASKQEIVNISGVEVGANLLRLDTKKIKQNILATSYMIDDVELNKNFPNELSINVKAAEKICSIKYQGKRYYISKGLRIVEIIEEDKIVAEEDILPTISGVDFSAYALGDHVGNKNEEKFEIVTDLLKILSSNNMLDKIKHIDVKDTISINLYYNNQYIIKLGNTKELEYKIKFANEIIGNQLEQNDKGILDVSIYATTYFKPESNVGVPQE